MPDSSPIPFEEVAKRVESLLQAAKVKSVSHAGSTVTFRGGSRARRMSGLNGLGSSQIRVEKRGSSTVAEYDLSMVPLLVRVIVVLPLLPLLAIILSSSSWSGHFVQNVINIYSDPFLIVTIPVLWLWIFGLTYLIQRFLFREWLMRVLGEAFPSARVRAVHR